MKVGLRTPNLKKSIKSRTTGKITRAYKKSINPFYGKKGIGLIHNPEKTIYNKIYSKMTKSVFDIHSKNDSNFKTIEENNLIEKRFLSHKELKQKRILNSKVKNTSYWNKKTHCCICERPLGILNLQLIDGWLCRKCTNKILRDYPIQHKRYTVEEIKSLNKTLK